MSAFLLLVVAALSRILPHPAWFNLTAVGGSLLYFGARRPLRELLIPVAAFAAVDYYLTTAVYHYAFALNGYLLTWAWYAAMVVLGSVLLKGHASFLRVASATVLGPTSFFLISNYAVWLSARDMYPASFAGLVACYAAAVPFYRNDVIGTALVLSVLFGLPALAENLAERARRTA